PRPERREALQHRCAGQAQGHSGRRARESETRLSRRRRRAPERGVRLGPRERLEMGTFLISVVSLFACAPALAQTPPAHFHHVHPNPTDPAAAIDFYTSTFKARKESFAGLGDAVWTGDSWLLFTRVDSPPPSELLSGIWHIGWGAEDMQSAYQQQLEKGT